MAVFELTLNERDWARYQIEGNYPLRLPGLRCSECGSTWSNIGTAYPCADVAGVAQVLASTDKHVVGNDEFEALVARIRPHISSEAVLKPGCALGPFSGTLRGRVYDLAWAEPWTVFFDRSAIRRLEERGVKMPCSAAPNLTLKGKGRLPDLLEPEAALVVDIARSSLKNPDAQTCPRCGRVASGFVRRVINSSTRLPDGVDLCRSRNCSTLYLVSERFAEAAEGLGLTGFVLNRLEEVSED